MKAFVYAAFRYDLSQGLTRVEIAVILNISANTAKSVLPNIYNKLGAANNTDAVRKAMEMKNLNENRQVFSRFSIYKELS